MRPARAADHVLRAGRFRIQPALTIDRSTASNGIAVLREVFDLVKRERLWEAE
jgi:hypothetical protein